MLEQDLMDGSECILEHAGTSSVFNFTEPGMQARNWAASAILTGWGAACSSAAWGSGAQTPQAAASALTPHAAASAH